MRKIYSHISKEYLSGKNVLDLGSGVQSASFILGCDPRELVALSSSENELKDVSELSDIVVPKLMDIKREVLAGESFDCIFASYFFSAVEGSDPLISLEILNKVKGLLNPTGVLILVDFSWMDPVTKAEHDAIRLFQMKDEIKNLLDISYPMQLPKEYYLDVFNQAGMKIVETGEMDACLEGEVAAKMRKSIQKYTDEIEDKNIRKEYEGEADALIKYLEPELPAKIGQEFLIIAK